MSSSFSVYHYPARIDSRVWKALGLLLLLTLGAALGFPPLAWGGAAAVLFQLWFFRDPGCEVSEGPALVSPAYGRITDIDEVREEAYLQADSFRIGIFLSLFSVHTQRSPLSGTVEYLRYTPGQFRNALRKDSARVNESNAIGIGRKDRRVLVRQIAGAIARKIHWDVRSGDALRKGAKLGVICYGSRVECYVPKKDFKISVQVGDDVKAGQTPLGEWKS